MDYFLFDFSGVQVHYTMSQLFFIRFYGQFLPSKSAPQFFYYCFWRIYVFSHIERKTKGLSSQVKSTHATVPFSLSLLLQQFLFFQIHSQQLRYLIHQLQAIFQMLTRIKLVRHQITAGTGAEFLSKALMKFQR